MSAHHEWSRWTAAEVKDLRHYYVDLKFSHQEIAQLFGRSMNSISSALRTYRISRGRVRLAKLEAIAAKELSLAKQSLANQITLAKAEAKTLPLAKWFRT